MVSDSVNRSIKYLEIDATESESIAKKDILITEHEAYQMLAVAIIRQAARDVLFGKQYSDDAKQWLNSDACDKLLKVIGINYTGRDIYNIAIKQKNKLDKRRAK